MSVPLRQSQHVNDNQTSREMKVESRGPKGWPAGSGFGMGKRLARETALDTRPSSLNRTLESKAQCPKSKVSASLTTIACEAFRPILPHFHRGMGNIERRTPNAEHRRKIDAFRGNCARSWIAQPDLGLWTLDVPAFSTRHSPLNP